MDGTRNDLMINSTRVTDHQKKVRSWRNMLPGGRRIGQASSSHQIATRTASGGVCAAFPPTTLFHPNDCRIEWRTTKVPNYSMACWSDESWWRSTWRDSNIHSLIPLAHHEVAPWSRTRSLRTLLPKELLQTDPTESLFLLWSSSTWLISYFVWLYYSQSSSNFENKTNYLRDQEDAG